MEFRIADTFLDSLNRLTGEEKKAVKTTAFDLQANPEDPGLSFHKLDRAKDRNFWSVRVGRDIRLIVHRTKGSCLLCYVDHHDKAYAWAERRKLEAHPKTGAAQLIEIRETIQDIVVKRFVDAPSVADSGRPLFEKMNDDVLLGFGVPSEWMPAVRTANEDSLLGIVEHLPAEAAEALLALAVGTTPVSSLEPTATDQSAPVIPSLRDTELLFDIGGEDDYLSRALAKTPIVAPDEGSTLEASFTHPDAQRRFRTIESVEELQRALEFPWDKWTVFLHPEQRALVEREQSGPARVSGSAGTGKTIVALHRAVYLAKRYPEGRVALATFSEPLASALAVRLRRLISDTPRLGERIDVAAIPALGERLYRSLLGPVQVASREVIERLIKEAAAKAIGNPFSMPFLLSEWDQVVDVWQIDSWEGYRDAARLGRKTRLREDRRQALWGIFEDVRSALDRAELVTEAGMFTRLAVAVKVANNPPYDFAVIDEAQDLSVAQLRFFAALGGGRPNALFFAGDLGQRIFQQPFSWKSVGVDVRGRGRTLKVNYRTSHQIRARADRLLAAEIADVDGNTESRRDAISVFNGVAPIVQIFKDTGDEIAGVAGWLRNRVDEGVAPHEIGVFVRSDAELERATAAIEAAGILLKVLDDRMEAVSGYAAVGTMHLAKGLEFRAVAVMACDDEIIPSQARIGAVGEDSDLKEVYDTERQLLYVACTRARDFLLVSGVDPASEFLEDMTVK